MGNIRRDIEHIVQYFKAEASPDYAKCFDIAYFCEKYSIGSVSIRKDDNTVVFWVDKTIYVSFRYSWNEPKLYTETLCGDTVGLIVDEKAVISVLQAKITHIQAMKNIAFQWEL